MKNHVYTHIQGWFDYQELYTKMVNYCPDGGHMVEVGAFVGKSSAYMVVEILNSGKHITFDAIDVFNWPIARGSYFQSPFEDIQCIGDIFDRHMEVFELHGFVNKVENDSVSASIAYASESLDFAFLDADHQYNSVRSDILAWLPKIKPGAFLGGHDFNEYESPGVIQAVDELLGIANVQLFGKENRSWLYQKPLT